MNANKELEKLRIEINEKEQDLISQQNEYIKSLEKQLEIPKTICGMTIEEVITILNGLEIERMTDIKMTMKNLSYLIKKVIDEQRKIITKPFFDNKIGGDIEIKENKENE